MDTDILRKKKLFLLDMDGTIYIDDDLFDKSIETLNHINSIGGKYMFLTNNSSKSTMNYIDKLKKLSIDVNKSNFMTSLQATSLYLKKHHNKSKIYVLGTKAMKEELLTDGFNIVDEYSKDIDCLLVGNDNELEYQKLIDACRILDRNVDYLATNPDFVCPTKYGPVPDCGSICILLEIATGKKPKYLGKPEPTMIDLSIQATGFTREQTIVIGDRLYTDIASGINAKVTTALVLSGETKLEQIEGNEFKPDFVFKDIAHLLSVIK